MTNQTSIMALGAQVWNDEKDVERFLGKILGHESKFATADQCQRQLEILESRESTCTGVENVALLYRHVGNVLLAQENPARAEFFLAKSVQLFKKIECGFFSSGSGKTGKKKKSTAKRKESVSVEVKRMLVEVLLARCWVRNCDNVETARKVLDEIISNFASCDVLPKAEVYINALITKVELLVNFSKGTNRYLEIAEICSEKVHAPFGILIKNNEHGMLHRFRVDLAVLYCNYVDFDPTECSSSIRLLTNCDEETKYFTAKAILRQGPSMLDLNIMDAERCVFGRRGFHWNDCALATAYYIEGDKILDKWPEKAVERFEKSFELRQTHLGSTHVETAKALFKLGCAKSTMADRTEDLDPKHLKIIKTALDSFELHNKGLHTFNNGALQFYSELLGRCGRLNEAIPFFEKSIENEVEGCDNCLIVPSVRRFDFGKLYEQFLRWSEAAELYEEAVGGLIGALQFQSKVADIYCHLGYCNCKLGKYEKAAEFFERARDFSQYCEMSEFKIVIKILLQQAENEFLRQEVALSRKIFMEGISLRLDFKNDAKMMSDETWCAIHLQMAFYYEYVDISLDLAKEYYENVLKYLEQIVHHRHPSICQILLSLSRVALKQENLVLSEGYAFRCLKVCESLLEPNDAFLEPIVSIFDQFLHQRKNVKKAKAVFLNYLDRFAKMQILENSIFIASFSFNFAKRLYNEEYTSSEEKNSLEKNSSELFQKCFRIFQTVCGQGDLKAAQSGRMMGLCLLRSGKLAEAEWHLFNSAKVLQLSKQSLSF